MQDGRRADWIGDDLPGGGARVVRGEIMPCFCRILARPQVHTSRQADRRLRACPRLQGAVDNPVGDTEGEPAAVQRGRPIHPGLAAAFAGQAIESNHTPRRAGGQLGGIPVNPHGAVAGESLVWIRGVIPRGLTEAAPARHDEAIGGGRLAAGQQSLTLEQCRIECRALERAPVRGHIHGSEFALVGQISGAGDKIGRAVIAANFYIEHHANSRCGYLAVLVDKHMLNTRSVRPTGVWVVHQGEVLFNPHPLDAPDRDDFAAHHAGRLYGRLA